jgi:hypothetical protein
MPQDRDNGLSATAERQKAIAVLEAKRTAIRKAAQLLRKLQAERDATEREVLRLSLSKHKTSKIVAE